MDVWVVDGWLCITSHRQRGHLETVPPFTVPCEGSEAPFYTVPIGNRTPSRRVAVHYRKRQRYLIVVLVLVVVVKS